MLALLFLSFLYQEPNDPIWSMLIEARITRSSDKIHALFEGDEDLDEAAVRQYLSTLGQIGDPRDLDRIVAYLDDRDYQETALLAYGEVDGAPIEPLLEIEKKVRGANTATYIEALAKLAGENDAARLYKVWRGLNRSQKNEALYFLWRRPGETLTESVLERIERGVNDRMDGYAYYLYRARIEVPPDVLAAILEGLDEDQALIHASRITATGSSDDLLDRLADLAERSDWRIRVNAIKALARLDAERAIEAGKDLLRDRNPNVVNAAVSALLGLSDPDGPRLVIEAAADFEQGTLAAAMASARAEQAAQLFPHVAKWFDNPLSWKKLRAIGYLGKAGERDRIDALKKMAGEGYSVPATLAIRALTELDALDRETARAALSSGDPHKMAAALTAFRDEKDASAWPTDLASLKSLAAKTYAAPDFHQAYLATLPTMVSESVFRAERDRLLAHPDYLVRMTALATIEQPTRAQRISVLEKGWQSGVPTIVRQLATRMIADRGSYTWTIDTNRGQIVIELDHEAAPITCANIVYLASKDHFNGLAVHRVVPNFVVQAGDNRGDGSGGPGYAIPCEINTLRFERGAVGMALSGKDTGGSQFFICHANQPHLDGGYTVFGKVTKGMRVVEEIQEGDEIQKTRVR